VKMLVQQGLFMLLFFFKGGFENRFFTIKVSPHYPNSGTLSKSLLRSKIYIFEKLFKLIHGFSLVYVRDIFRAL